MLNNEILNNWLQPKHHATLRTTDHPALREIRANVAAMPTSQIVMLLSNLDVFFETMEERAPYEVDFEKIVAAGVIALNDEIDVRVPPRQGSVAK
jgi:hypothetical protein